MLSQIKQQLEPLNPQFLEVTDQSHFHQKGTNSHFKLTLVSAKFKNLNKVQKHQLIYQTLSQIMLQIHALEIHAFTPNEWQQNPKIYNSPNCLGGGLLG